MAEQLQRLSLKNAYMYVDAPSRKEQNATLRDIQNIHDPSRLKLGMWWQRLWGIHHIKLGADPHDEACALFDAHCSITPENKIHLWLKDASLPQQAAGWAALQLYGELSRGKSQIVAFNAVDPLKGTYGRGHIRTHNGILSHLLGKHIIGEAPIEASIFDDFRRDEEILFAKISPESGYTGAEVMVENHKNHSLPGLLHVIKDAYDEMYHASDSSTAVAGIVGARNLEAFDEAWAAAAKHEPVAAARKLLESDIFLS